jgi:hypothetical protein
MKNYRDQTPPDSCASCKKVFVKIEYDDYLEYFCNKEHDRPLCGSVFLCEQHRSPSDEEFNAQYDQWEQWAEDHKVNENGICDNYITKIKL